MSRLRSRAHRLLRIGIAVGFSCMLMALGGLSAYGASTNDVTCKVIVAGLNLRAGPGTGYNPPIQVLRRDAIVTPLSRNYEGTWIQVEVNGSDASGWVSASTKYITCRKPLRDLPIVLDGMALISACGTTVVECDIAAAVEMPAHYRPENAIVQDPINMSLADARAVLIQISSAPYDWVARSTVTWGYNDSAGEFVSAGMGVLDHNGGVIFGEVPGNATANNVVVKVAVDYVNPVLQDEVREYRVPVETFGAHLLVDPTSGILRNRVSLKVEGDLTSEDYLVFAWVYGGNEGIQRQSGAEWLFWPSLIKARDGYLTLDFGVPVIDRKWDSKIDWTLTGTLNGKTLMANGSIPSDRFATIMRIDVKHQTWIDGVKSGD